VYLFCTSVIHNIFVTLSAQDVGSKWLCELCGNTTGKLLWLVMLPGGEHIQRWRTRCSQHRAGACDGI